MRAPDLYGLYAAIPIPFGPAGELDERAFRANVARLAAAAVDGIYTTDSTGEFWALNLGEFRQVVGWLAAELEATTIQRQVGCTWIDTRGVIDRIRIALDTGIDVVHVALPFWIPLTDGEIERFFTDIFDACPRARVIHYNTPRSKRVFTGADYQRWSAVFPGLVGSKFPPSDYLGFQDVRLHSPDLAHFVCDNLALPGLMSGARGVFSALANVSPQKMVRLYQACRRRDWETALAAMEELNRFLVHVATPLVRKGHLDPVVDKIMVQLTGFLQGGRAVRPPFQTIGDEEMEEVRVAARQMVPEWFDPPASPN